MKKLLIIMMAVTVILTACTSNKKEETDLSKISTVEIAKQKDINTAAIAEDETVYSNDDPESIVCFYVTVRKGATNTETDHTFSEVNNVRKFQDDMHVDTEVKTEALLQVGDETGPLSQMLGYGETRSNATIEVRGNSTSTEAQKSYTIRLNDSANLWRGQQKIALVKSVYDSTRFRNKLYFDLLKDIPAVPSLRTQLVHVYIKDETSSEKSYTDYGLFTQVETPNKKYLKNHGLDGSGYLYKARSFNFELSGPIKNFDEDDFDLEMFEKVLTCSGREDNEKLIEMINAVNDPKQNFDEVFEKYFDRENYLNWMAYNILMGNIDTTMQNFFIYSPLNGDKWYFIPWDGDGSLMKYELKVKNIYGYSDWEKGISNYWGISLHKKFLSSEENRKQLTEKIELLKNNYLTKEKVTTQIELYNNAISTYPIKMPDLLYLQATPEQREDIISRLYDEIEENYNNYYATLEGMMSFYLAVPIIDGDTAYLSWDESYDMKGQLINYKLLISTTPEFIDLVYVEDNIRTFSAEISGLKPGQYFWKIVATAEDGRTATAFNQIRFNSKYYGGIESLVIE